MAVTGIERVRLRPLSSAQSGIWFAQMLDPHSPVYNIGEYLEIVGPIDPELFETALRQVVAECDALRLRVVETNEGPRQYIGADPDWSMLFFDVSGEADPCAVAETWMHEDMARVVDLTHGYALFRAATNLFFWYARYHHICNDGFGFSWVARRLAAVFSALIGDKPLETGNYGSWFDLLDEEDEYRLSARYVHAREYWHNQLAQRPEPVTLSGILGMHVTGRSGARMHGTVGMISNVLLLRVVIDLKNSFDLLQQVSWRMRQCLRHQRYRAELHAEELGLYGTIVNIMPFDYDLRFAGYPSHAHNLSLGPVTELAIAVYDRRDGSNPEDRLRREPSELHRRGACLAPAAFLGHARSTAYDARSVAASAGNP